MSRVINKLSILLIIVFASLVAKIPMRPAKIFMALPLLALATESVAIRLFLVVSKNANDVKVTANRIVAFLQLGELPDIQTRTADVEKQPPNECRIHIDNVHAKWDQEVEQPTLQNVSATVEPGKLLAVIGPVGAGKSSLLMAVLKELPLSEGQIELKGRVAYVSQQPWVFSASLRQNIVFGNKYEKVRYDRILKACALNKDINIMPHGDMTLIGDRGVSLSGGQRARVSLARALYMDADVYLLDDPLSAVDASVGRHLFENVVQGILKNKPRILVTHQLQFLKEAEQILILKEGEMIGKGTFQELSTSGVDFSALLKRDEDDDEDKDGSKAHLSQSSHLGHLRQPAHIIQRSVSHDAQHKSHDHHRRLQDTPILSKSHDHLNGNSLGVHHRKHLDSFGSKHSIHDSIQGSLMSLTSIGTEFEAENVQLPEEEERHEGTIGWGVYFHYIKAGAGLLKFIVLTVLCLAAQGAYIVSDWWLSRWSNEEEDRYAAMQRALAPNATNVTIPIVDTDFNISVFSAIIGGVFLFGILRALMFFKVAVDASQALHNTMFSSILRSHIGFFDTNPVGRILNRFSKDVGHMDDLLPITFFDFTQCSLLILGIVCVAGVVNPWVFLCVVPLIVLFVIIRRYYIRTSRHIKRLEGTTRSPVFSHLSATLQGLHTIRAFGVEDKFVEEFDAHQDLHTESWFLFLTSSRWLAIRLDWLCAMFVTAVSFFCVIAADSLNAGLVGLSMTYAMTLMGMFQWGVRQSAEVENQMISVERVLDYSNLPSEAPLESSNDKQPPSDWPQHGEIKVENVSLRYSDEAPLVLKDLTFTFMAREKIGIVGRTGAGKSSLITMLFRLVEPTGQIQLDGVDILKIGLHDLRKHISIIPQDPVLFTGKLRRNLDPFSNHSDDALWSALAEVQLKQAIEDLPQGLDSEVSEGGINFSVGQRQLICLARAILRNNKILMIDEATANVDPRTDALIQETIRDKFKNCTVLTIAHRLHTIMDSDRLMVLDEGQIIEFDAPYLLLQKTSGMLRKLVEQTGKAETMNLLEIARKAYEKSPDSDGKNTNANSGEDEAFHHSEHDITMTIEEDAETESTNASRRASEATKTSTNSHEAVEGQAKREREQNDVEGEMEAGQNGAESLKEHVDGGETRKLLSGGTDQVVSQDAYGKDRDQHVDDLDTDRTMDDIEKGLETEKLIKKGKENGADGHIRASVASPQVGEEIEDQSDYDNEQTGLLNSKDGNNVD